MNLSLNVTCDIKYNLKIDMEIAKIMTVDIAIS